MDFITDLDEKETEENKILIDIINNIDERYDIISEKIKYTYCEKFILMFDNIIEGFKEAGKYLYLSGRPYVLDSDGFDYDQDGACDDGDYDDDNDGSLDDDDSSDNNAYVC